MLYPLSNTPLLDIVINKKSNNMSQISPKNFENIINACLASSIFFFKITGVEPLSHDRFDEIIELITFYKKKFNCHFVLSSNSNTLHKYPRVFCGSVFDVLKINIHSISDLDEVYCQKNRNNIGILDKNIKITANYLVSQSNYKYINDIINNCIRYKFSLKILDLQKEVKDSHYSWDKAFIPLKKLRSSLRDRADHSYWVTSCGGYGIPMEEFLIKNIFVRVKDSTVGTTYHSSCWKSCDYFPCPDGAFTITVDQENKVSWCKRNKTLGSACDDSFLELPHRIQLILQQLQKTRMFMQDSICMRDYGSNPLIPIEAY